ncbi:hypothetical protein IKF81_01175 [Candidatus Saccharibacteria bacterium]|nr:hypothetical protein [Candidatus Saccharibacteria bacterium]
MTFPAKSVQAVAAPVKIWEAVLAMFFINILAVNDFLLSIIAQFLRKTIGLFKRRLRLGKKVRFGRDFGANVKKV